ncbi:MAG: pitrilysin family protein [Marinoscillum sp.]
MLDRSVAPPAVSIERPNLPSLDEIKINDGLRVHVLNQGAQPVVLFEIVIPVGRFQEPTPGLSYYLFKMLTEGTTSKSSEQIASIFDFYGSHLEITPTLDYVSIKLYALNKFFPQLLKLLTEMLTESTFPSKEFETQKAIRTQNIKQQNAKNTVFASFKFRELIYGQTHPYGRIITPEQCQLTTREELLAFAPSVRTKPQIFVTGQVTEEIIRSVSECLSTIDFNEFPDSEKAEIIGGKSETITREGSTQASLRIGGFTIDKHHEDIHRLKITNEILGGFFGSRLMKNIREEKGLTYGIHSSILHLQHSSYWSIGSELLADKVDLGISEINKEISILQNNAPNPHEMEMVTNYMKGKFLSSFDSPFSAHDMMKNLILNDLSDQYFFDFFDTVQNITAEEISTTAQKYFNPEQLTQLVIA